MQQLSIFDNYLCVDSYIWHTVGFSNVERLKVISLTAPAIFGSKYFTCISSGGQVYYISRGSLGNGWAFSKSEALAQL